MIIKGEADTTLFMTKFLNSEVRKVIKDAAYFKYTHAQVTLYITTQYAYYLEKVFLYLKQHDIPYISEVCIAKQLFRYLHWNWNKKVG